MQFLRCNDLLLLALCAFNRNNHLLAYQLDWDDEPSVKLVASIRTVKKMSVAEVQQARPSQEDEKEDDKKIEELKEFDNTVSSCLSDETVTRHELTRQGDVWPLLALSRFTVTSHGMYSFMVKRSTNQNVYYSKESKNTLIMKKLQ